MKHLIKAFENHATQAVDTCRAAAQRSRPLEAYLMNALPAEVDALAEIVSERLIGLDLLDTGARQLLAQRRDRALAERRPPVVETKAPTWPKVQAWVLAAKSDLVDHLEPPPPKTMSLKSFPAWLRTTWTGRPRA